MTLFEKIKYYYEQKLYTIEHLNILAQKGFLTSEELNKIVKGQ